jgi:hypothetical protein
MASYFLETHFNITIQFTSAQSSKRSASSVFPSETMFFVCLLPHSAACPAHLIISLITRMLLRWGLNVTKPNMQFSPAPCYFTLGQISPSTPSRRHPLPMLFPYSTAQDKIPLEKTKNKVGRGKQPYNTGVYFHLCVFRQLKAHKRFSTERWQAFPEFNLISNFFVHERLTVKVAPNIWTLSHFQRIHWSCLCCKLVLSYADETWTCTVRVHSSPSICSSYYHTTHARLRNSV